MMTGNIDLYFRCVCNPTFDGPKCERIKYKISDKNIPYYLKEKVEGSKKFRLSFQMISVNKNGTGAIISLSKRYNSTDEYLLVIGLDGGHPALSLTINGSTVQKQLSSYPVSINQWLKFHVIEKKNELLFLMERCNYYDFSDYLWSRVICSTEKTNLIISAAFNMSGATACLGNCNSNISYKNFKYKRGLKNTCVADLIINGVLQNMNSPSEVLTGICGEMACGVKKSSYGHCGRNAVCYGAGAINTPLYYCECKNGYASNSDKQISPCNISKFHQSKWLFIAKLEIRFLQFSVIVFFSNF